MIVYVDVLIATNFIVNYLLILVSGRLCGTTVSRPRVAAAAVLGALASLAIFLPAPPAWCAAAGKILLTVLVAALAGGYSDWRGLIKRIVMLLAASFVFAGLMLFVTVTAGGDAAMYVNGAVYFNLSAVQLLGFSAAAYLLLALGGRIFRRGLATDREYRVEITAHGRTLAVPGVMDSQNHLTDFFTGTPVVIGSRALLADILPPGVTAALDSSLSDAAGLQGVRLIPCGTVAGRDILPAFRPDRMILRRGDIEIDIEDVYLAVSAQLDGGSARKLILNPALTGRKRQRDSIGKGGVLKGDGDGKG